MATISIDGSEYQFSAEYDLGEARIIKRYTNLNLQELETHDPTDPDLVAAFIHIVLRREQPALSFAELEERTNAVKLASINMREGAEDADASPPVISDEPPAGDNSNGSPEAFQEIASLVTIGRPA